MKKFLSLCVVLSLLVLASSCVAKKETPPPPAATIQKPALEPIIDTSKTGEIDAQLARYEGIVAQYLADSGDKKTDAVSADELKLAVISDELSKSAVNFTPEQLKKYNEITAKLDN